MQEEYDDTEQVAGIWSLLNLINRKCGTHSVSNFLWDILCEHELFSIKVLCSLCLYVCLRKRESEYVKSMLTVFLSLKLWMKLKALMAMKLWQNKTEWEWQRYSNSVMVPCFFIVTFLVHFTKSLIWSSSYCSNKCFFCFFVFCFGIIKMIKYLFIEEKEVLKLESYKLWPHT